LQPHRTLIWIKRQREDSARLLCGG